MEKYTVEDIKTGNVDPSLCFKYTGSFDRTNFEYPISALVDREGYWDINGKRNIRHDSEKHEIVVAEGISDEEIAKFKELINSEYDETYYIQQGECDYHSWYVLAKVKDCYIYFEASCDYTGFHCRGGGTFAYSTDWKTLWNMHTTNQFRSLILAVNNIEKPVIGSLFYNDEQFLKSKGIL